VGIGVGAGVTGARVGMRVGAGVGTTSEAQSSNKRERGRATSVTYLQHAVVLEAVSSSSSTTAVCSGISA
jgi:hypothetical protein